MIDNVTPLRVPEVELLIASAHPVVREGLLALLETVEAEIKPVGMASSDVEVLSLVPQLRPDVVLLDMQLCGEDQTPTLTRRIRAREPEARVLVLSPMSQGREVCQALDDGAGGLVSKTAEAPQLVQAIRYVASGEGCGEAPDRGRISDFPLTSRQTDVLECVSRGMTNDEIAFALCISTFTVKAHLEHIRHTLGVTDRASAVAKAFRQGLIH